jgi:transcriptional regulator with XRE-family HTH domain
MRSVDQELRCELAEFGSKLAELRKIQGLSRLDLADIAGVHESTVANIERGLVDCSIIAVSLILMNLGCEGVAVGDHVFDPVYRERSKAGIVFPGLTTNRALMAATIGKAVRQRRLELGLSKEEISCMSGIHRNTIGNVELGLVAPSVCTTYRLYRSLQVKRVIGSNEGIILL